MNEEKRSSSVTFIVLVLLTIGWLIALGYFTFKIVPNGHEPFLDRFLAELDANELGDYLAGAFAPLAFIWLAGAVLIQSKELQAQRDELRATKEIYIQEIELIKAQSEDMKANTELTRLQVSANERSAKRADDQAHEEEFKRAIDLFAAWLKESCPHEFSWTPEGSNSYLRHNFGKWGDDGMSCVVKFTKMVKYILQKKPAKWTSVSLFRSEEALILNSHLKRVLSYDGSGFLDQDLISSLRMAEEINEEVRAEMY